MHDELKLTRKRFKTELQAAIRPEEERELFAFRDRLMSVFSDEMIQFAEETDQWESIIRSSLPELRPPNWPVARIFVLQTRYSEESNGRKEQQLVAISIDGSGTESEEETSFSSSCPPIQRVSRKSSAMTTATPPRLTSFIETSFRDAIMPMPDENGTFETPSRGSPMLQEIRSELEESNKTCRIVLKRCACGFSDGSSIRCDCVSLMGKYLIVSQVVRSRQASLIKSPELLVRYKPFSDGKEWPPSWIPLEVLAQWRSGPLVDYLLSRIRFPSV